MFKEPKNYKWILVAACLVAYAQTFFFQNALDDYLVIIDNEIVEAGFERINEIFTTPMTWGVGYNDGLYRPIPLLTYALEIELLGEHNATFSHAVNVFLYMLLSVVLLRSLEHIFPKTSQQTLFIIALLFALHPLHTEVVANIKSRDELLGFLFALLALNHAIEHLKSNKISSLVYSGFLFGLALLSKESTLIFILLIPLGALLLDESKNSDILKLTGVLALPAASYLWLRNLVITEWVPAVEITNMYSKLANSLAGVEGLEKFGMASYLVAKYFLMGVFPINQAYEYSYNMIPIMPITNIWVIASILLHLALFYIAYAAFKKNAQFTAAILFFYGTIALFSNLFILIGVTFAERFAFMSSLGSVMFMVFGIQWLALRYKKNDKMVMYLFMGLMAVYGIKTFVRAQVWENNETLFIGDYENNQNSVKAKYNAGTQYSRLSRDTPNSAEKRRLQNQAIAMYKEALELHPSYRDARNNLGNLYLETKQFNEALVLFDQNLQDGKVNVLSLYNRAVTYFQLEQYQSAVNDFEQYIAIDRNGKTNLPLAYYFLGRSYGYIGNFEAAIQNLDYATQLNPNYWEAHHSLGKAYGMQGNFELALTHLYTALRFVPQMEMVRFDLALTHLNNGDIKEGKTALIQLNKDFPNNVQYIELLNNL